MTEPRRLAYADPPYPGQAASRYGGVEVNHRLLVAYLDTFDGWALSTSASALREIWNLAPHARCASWVKTYAVNTWCRIRYSWEPVLFVTDRKGLEPGERQTTWDSLVAAPVTATNSWREVNGRGGGVKPPEFVHWVLELLDHRDGDEVVDVFPGSRAVTRHAAQRQLDLDEVV
jgi:hypothetical protein